MDTIKGKFEAAKQKSLDFKQKAKDIKLNALEPVNKMLKRKAETLEQDLSEFIEKNPYKEKYKWYGNKKLGVGTKLPNQESIGLLDGYKDIHKKCAELGIGVDRRNNEMIFYIIKDYDYSDDSKLFGFDVKSKPNNQPSAPETEQETEEATVEPKQPLVVQQPVDLSNKRIKSSSPGST